MMRYIFYLLIGLITINGFAQNDVTKFLGIPVDGTKAEMIQKLKSKGFKSSYYNKDILEGEFNGVDVNIHIITNKNKVWRIAVIDTYSLDWKNIIPRYNMLLTQFRDKPNTYTQLCCSDEIRVLDGYSEIDYTLFNSNLKQDNYTAFFTQESEDIVMTKITPNLLLKYTQEQIDNPDFFVGLSILGEKANYIIHTKKPVHFSIIEDDYNHSQYRIFIFYDNEYNKANGEDL